MRNFVFNFQAFLLGEKVFWRIIYKNLQNSKYASRLLIARKQNSKMLLFMENINVNIW